MIANAITALAVAGALVTWFLACWGANRRGGGPR